MLENRKPTQAVVIARRYTQGMSYPSLQQFEFTVVPFTPGHSRCYYNAIKAAGHNPVGCRNGSWGVRAEKNWTTGYVFPIRKTVAQAIKRLKESHGEDGVPIIVNPAVKAPENIVARKPRMPKPLPPIGTRRYALSATSTFVNRWRVAVQLYTVVCFKRSKRIGWRKGWLQLMPGDFPTRNLALAAARVFVTRWTGAGTLLASK